MKNTLTLLAPLSSGLAKASIISGANFFATSEIPLSVVEMASNRSIKMMPLATSALALVYNVPWLSNGLQLTKDTVVKIMTGVITHWDDPAIIASNPEISGGTVWSFQQ